MPIKLQPHQQFTLDKFLASPNRGLFIIHGAGSGKTLTAIAIAEHLRKYKEVLVIAPKSLHDNMRHAFNMYSNSIDKKRYRFISSNAGNMADKLETSVDDITGVEVKSLHLDNKLIIIDEAHNMLGGMSNGSKNATALYNMLMSARHCRIIMMTASPIVNNVYEAAIAMNICKGYIKTEDNELTTILPEDANDFMRFFVNKQSMKLKNTDKLMNRISGLISYKGDLFERKVPNFYDMLKTTVKQENYPDYSIQVVPVRMSHPQYSAYETAREKERLETRKAIVGHGIEKKERIVLCPDIKEGGMVCNGYTITGGEVRDANYMGGELKGTNVFKTSTSYRVRSRQISNVYMPDDENIDIYEHIGEYAPKIETIGKKLKIGQKTIIYSNFIQSGIAIMEKYLEKLGYKRYSVGKSMEDGINGYFGIYTGDVSPEDRTATLEEYNKPDSPLTILLISASGSEGLSTIGTRVVHIMEPYWNWERVMQVMFRAIRFKSHSALPEKDRNVKVYIYIALPPNDIKATEITTDMYLFKEMERKYEINQQMVRLMASVAVDCDEFNKADNLKCHHCESLHGAPLYLPDINKDMSYPSPCKTHDKPINVKEITISGHQYFVSDDRVFILNKDDQYEEVLDNDIRDWILSKTEHKIEKK